MTLINKFIDSPVNPSSIGSTGDFLWTNAESEEETGWTVANAGLLASRWQKSFYAHIIRCDNGLNHIRQYSADDPLKWNWIRTIR